MHGRFQEIYVAQGGGGESAVKKTYRGLQVLQIPLIFVGGWWTVSRGRTTNGQHREVAPRSSPLGTRSVHACLEAGTVPSLCWGAARSDP